MKFQLVLEKGFPKKVFLSLAAIQLILVLIYTVIFIINNRTSAMFDLDAEGNIPAWFSAIQLFMIGIVLSAGNMNHPSFNNLTKRFITLMALVFIFLSMDEAAKVHETLSNILKSEGWKLYFKNKSGVWIILYSAAAFPVVIWGWKAFINLYKNFTKEMKIIIAGFIVMFFGAVVLETLSYQYLKDGLHEFLYKVEVVVEEYSEMLGASIMLYGAMQAMLKCQTEGLIKKQDSVEGKTSANKFVTAEYIRGEANQG